MDTVERSPETVSPVPDKGRRFGGGGNVERDPLASKLLSLPALLLVVIGFLLPLLVLVVYSFWPTVNGQILHEWTFDNYSKIFESGGTYLPTLLDTFKFVGLSALATVVLTFPLAYFVAVKVRPSRRIFWLVAAVVPFWTSYLIRVFAWKNMFGDTGVINTAITKLGLSSTPLEFFGFSRPAILITFVYLLFPLAFLTSYISLERLDIRLLEAASDLGAKPWRRLTSIIVPFAKSGLIAGFIVCFITMVGDYVTPSMIGGTEGIFFSNLVVNQFGGSLQWGFGAALGLILLISILLLLVALRATAGAVASAGEYTRVYVKERSPFLVAYSILYMVFLYTPIALLILFALNDSQVVGFPIKGFTLEWFQAVFDDPSLIDALYTSLQVAAITVLISVVLGTLAAVQLARAKGRIRNLSLLTISAPMLLPPVVLGIGIIIGLNAVGAERGLWSIIMAHVILTLPVATLLVMVRLEGFDRSQEQAAMDLGAKPVMAFLRITLPQALPGIVAAAMISFALSMDEFIMTFLVTGSDVTLPLYIFGSIRFEISPALMALAALIIIVSFLLIVIGAFVAFGRSKALRTDGGSK
ncbi:MAG: ABC transporter permease subunit [Solirubrobacterales bacterium]|nr:ABC transporter permease subunit [Solirubrobacterales bacterium]